MKRQVALIGAGIVRCVRLLDTDGQWDSPFNRLPKKLCCFMAQGEFDTMRLLDSDG